MVCIHWGRQHAHMSWCLDASGVLITTAVRPSVTKERQTVVYRRSFFFSCLADGAVCEVTIGGDTEYSLAGLPLLS